MAQNERTSLTGVVTDPQGNRIPQAKVMAVEDATGLRRDTQTNSQGSYVLADLPPGVFTIRFSRDGFSVYQANKVRQVVGQTGRLDVKLSLGVKAEEATINESVVQLDTVDVTVGGAVEQHQVDELPINGRNWSTLTALAPGAIDNGAGDQRTIRFAGHGLDDNNLTLDGVDATAIFNQMQREYVRLTIPLESIQEFDVKSQTYGADVEGGTSGGQIAVVSPSGTNAFHGNAFDNFRNDVFEARTPFNAAAPNPFLQNQFGGSAGGPIVRNKLFFFATYEGLRQRLDGTQIGLVPSPSFLAQAAIASPALIPILKAFPLGTSPTASANVWNYTANGRQIDNEDSGMIRLDYHPSTKTTGFLRYNADHAYATTPTGNLTALTVYDTKFNNGVAEMLHVFAPNLINELKFGINQDFYHSGTLSPLPYTVSVSGFSTFGGNTTSDYPSKTISILDDWSWSKAGHTLKFGFEIKRDFLNQGSSQKGTLSYSSTTNFLNNVINTASYTALLPLVRQRKTQYWMYAEDEWKVSSNFTVNLGVRYNIFNALHAIDNQARPFDFATCGGFCPNSYSFFNPRYNDIDPRVGLAWSHGNTVVRAGAGIYHTDGQLDDQNLPISNTIQAYSFNSTAFPGLSYPLTPFLAYAQAGGLGVVSPRALDRNRKDAYVAAWTASVQQKLRYGFVGTVNYLGNKGTDILTTTYVNLATPGTNVVPYPAFGAVSWRGDVGNSVFEGLQSNLRRTFANGFLLSMNYMWSHSINDDSIGGGESGVPQNSFCRACDRASSDDDIRHTFNISGVYALPLKNRFWGNWEVSAIGSAQTGLPVNITVDRSNSAVPGLYSISGAERPNYVSGVSLTPAGGSTPGAWINPAAFAVPANGTFGNLGRNAFRARGISQLDLGLSKFTLITERVSLRLRADLFNVLNRAQYGAPNADISTANFGTITSTIGTYNSGRGTPRELQLSAKFVF